MEEEDKGTVCVTGGTGFIASWLVKNLLEQGYSVRTTVRSYPEQKKDLSFLTNLPGASEKLRIFNADLRDPGSFDAAIEGCIGVFHLATPVDFEGKESEEVVTQRAVNGTLGILKSCLKSKTVKRVVYTSSLATVVFNGKRVDTVDETYWSDVDYIRKTFGGSYMISKTVTERTTLEFAEEHGLDLVSIIPPFVLGPFICPNLPGSVRSILAMIFGNKHEYGNLPTMSVVHVDDLVRALIFLLEHPDVKGRYICSSEFIAIQQMSKMLSSKYPEYPIPIISDSLTETKGSEAPALSSKLLSRKLLDTGFKFKCSAIDMFDDAIRCCKEIGYM